MSVIDWVKNRGQQQQQNALDKEPPKPGEVKEMYAEKAAQIKAAEKPITPEVKAQADRAAAIMQTATSHRQEHNTPAAPEGGSNNAHLQKQNNQDKTQEALSPTDGTAGKTAIQEKDKTPEKSEPKPQPTVARRPPSWER